MRPRFLTLLFVLALFSVTVLADQTIEGVVKDKTGGVIPGVTITLISVDTGANRQVITDDQGYYVLNAIRTGAYEIKAELDGFQTQKITGVKVAVGDKLSYPFTLEVSDVTTEVEVKAQVEQVETSTSQIDNVIDEKRINDLPLNGRNPLNLILLTPGVVTSQNGYASANGARSRGNNYQLDGIDNNYTQTIGNAVDVNTDSAAEFRVVTSNPSAEYGRSGGAIVDVLTKAGTNTFHGNAFYFIRAENLDAKTWVENYRGLEKGDYKRHEYGGSIGGPIIKDKLFFFFNTDLTRLRQTTVVTAYVPSQSFRDSVTNPEMARIFNTYYPLSNNNVDKVAGVSQEYIWTHAAPTNTDQYTAKIDYNFSTAHTFSGRYTRNSTSAPYIVGVGGGYLPGFSNTRDFTGTPQGWALNWTWIVNPSMVNDMRAGFTRTSFQWLREWRDMDLNFGGYAAEPLRYLTDFGGPWGYGDEDSVSNIFQLKDTITWNRGSHNIKFGADLRWNQNNGGSGFNMVPTAFFDPWQHDGTTADNIRHGQVDYINHGVYGDGTQFSTTQSDIRGWRQREFDLFIQDDWKILPNLTLNLGLRYEYKPAPYEVNNLATNVVNPAANGYHLVNQLNFFDPANWQGGNWENFIANWVGSGSDLILCGPDTGNDIYQAETNNFAPRAGFSWDPRGDGKTAIRGGYGISFDRMFGNLLTWNAAQLPFGASNFFSGRQGGYDGTLPGNVSYYGHGVNLPSPALHLGPESWEEMVLFNYNLKTPYIQTWNFSVQRELWAGNIFNVSYLGSAGVHLLGRNDPNQMPHPTAELIQGIIDNYGTSTRVPADIRYYSINNTQFLRIHNIDNVAHSNYHSLQTSFSHRYQNGLQFQINYTWSKAFDNNSEPIFSEGGSSPFTSDFYNPGYDRGYASYDIRHVMTANFIYELPFGPGKRFGGNTTGWLGGLVGGWQINGIFSANSGTPLDYKVPTDTLGTGYVNNRAPARPNVANWNFTIDKSNNILGPTAANFTNWRQDINLANPQGNYYRGYFRGPGFFNMDFSLFKEVKLPWFTSEGATMQVRAEAFNMFNRTNFQNPVLTLGDSQLGQSFTTNANRQIQFGLKFIF